jgi:transketolase N-terminal domain/subunit
MMMVSSILSSSILSSGEQTLKAGAGVGEGSLGNGVAVTVGIDVAVEVMVGSAVAVKPGEGEGRASSVPLHPASTSNKIVETRAIFVIF